MFTSFFQYLRKRGLKVSLDEWLGLLEALEKGLHRSSLTGFYNLCRALLVKSETEYDAFDQAFLEYFKDLPDEIVLSEELLQWLNAPDEDLGRDFGDMPMKTGAGESMEEMLRALRQRLREQTAKHNGGSYWVGTQGYTAWGNSGWHPGGIRIGGEGRQRTALTVASERKFRDVRRDNTLDSRQFQMAFRTLRQLSVQTDSSEQELDVERTIHDTGENAGLLKVRYKKPRKNTVKLLLLMDSGGSMELHASLCSMLFQAATKSNYFQKLSIYYFHNCIRSKLYPEPTLARAGEVSTAWVLRNFDSSYRVIIVGDAEFHPYELRDPEYDWTTGAYSPSGMEWLNRLREQYPHLIWLNPEPMPEASNYWTQTHYLLGKLFEMYDLTVEGLEQGMKRLMVRR